MLAKFKKNAEFIVTAGFLLLFSVTFLNAEKWINAMTFGEYEVGPYAFPKAACMIAFVLMCVISVKQIKLARAGLLVVETGNEEKPTYGTMLPIVAVSMLYVWVMPKIGFIIASLILLPSLLLIAGVRKPKMIILVTLGVFLVAFAFFCLLLKLQLPRGVGIFKKFSLLFY